MKAKYFVLSALIASFAWGCNRPLEPRPSAVSEPPPAVAAAEAPTRAADDETASNETQPAAGAESAPLAGGGIFSILSVPAAAAQGATASPPPLDPATLDLDRILRAIRGQLEDIPPHVDMKLENIRPASVPGLALADLVMSVGQREQSQVIYLSTDGRFVSVFPLYEVKKATPSAVAGLQLLKLVNPVDGEVKELYASDDGTLVSLGEFWDTNVDPNRARMKKIGVENAPVRGKVGSKVVMIEFSDFQCPFCSKAQQMIQSRLYPAYKDKVEFRFKFLPLSFHDWARPAALAGLCAAEQGNDKFWAAYNYFFDNQRTIRKANVEGKIREMTQKAGLNASKFQSCYDESRYAARLEKDMQEAQSVGITGTPGFLINGRKIAGAVPYEQFKAILDDELSRN